jgi:hypothetical protein
VLVISLSMACSHVHLVHVAVTNLDVNRITWLHWAWKDSHDNKDLQNQCYRLPTTPPPSFRSLAYPQRLAKHLHFCQSLLAAAGTAA